MKIFKDLLTGDELFVDTYKYKLVDDFYYEVYGKHITRKMGSVDLDGANPSQEEEDEGVDEATESGIDVVLNMRLAATGFGSKKDYLAYLKKYMKTIETKLNEERPGDVEKFKTGANNFVKNILTRFKDLEFYQGESMDPDGLTVILEYKDIDGEERPCFYFFKDGLLEEKL